MGQLVFNGVAQAGTQYLYALALALALFPMRVFHAALAGVAAVAGYTVVLLVNLKGLPAMAALGAGILLACTTGLILEMAVYRPLAGRRSSRLSLAISSLAVYLILTNVLAALFSSQQGMVEGGGRTISVNGLVVTFPQWLAIALAIGVYIAMTLLLKTPFGVALRAMTDSEDLLRTCGWNLARLRTICTLLGSGMGGIAGALTALDTGVEPGMGLSGMLNALVIVVVAGTGSYQGLLPIALLLSALQQVFGYVVSPRWESAVSFAVLAAVLLVSPSGLFASGRRAEEMV